MWFKLRLPKLPIELMVVSYQIVNVRYNLSLKMMALEYPQICFSIFPVKLNVLQSPTLDLVLVIKHAMRDETPCIGIVRLLQLHCCAN